MTDARTSTPGARDARLGTTIAGRYRLGWALGEGGIGTVYLAEDLQQQQRVAIKLLKPEMCSQPEILARFEREAKAMSALAHPNAVHALDFGRAEDGAAFMVMELAEGETLRAALRRSGALPMPTAIEFARQIGAALTRAHSLGIVHRDLKPENVMVTTDTSGSPRLKVLDFGMARVVGGSFAGGTPLTKQGSVFGTPEYMPPEQASGQPVDAAGDQYAFGVMLYEMLAGRRPFAASTPLELVQLQIHAPLPPLAQTAPWISPEVAAVVEKMLTKQAVGRFPDVGAAVDALLQAGIRASAAPASPSRVSPSPSAVTSPSSAAKANANTWRLVGALILAAVMTAVAIGLQSWARSLGGGSNATAPSTSGTPAGR